MIENKTSYALTVFLAGPVDQEVSLGPDGSQLLTIQPGKYEIGAKAMSVETTPFYGL